MLHAQKNAAHVDRHDPVERLERMIDDGSDRALPAGIVHEDVDAAPAAARRLDVALDVGRIADVGLRDMRPVVAACRLARAGLVEIDREHVGAGLQQRVADGPADAAGGAGDDGGAAGQIDPHARARWTEAAVPSSSACPPTCPLESRRRSKPE